MIIHTLERRVKAGPEGEKRNKRKTSMSDKVEIRKEEKVRAYNKKRTEPENKKTRKTTNR